MSDRPTVVVGAGVVGLAVARALARTGREVIVLEAHDRIGAGVSSRNSEVVHAGIYYPPGSLKATTCVRGRQLLYAYCQDHGVPHRQTGKLVVATHTDQTPRLEAIRRNALASGVPEVVRASPAEARALEPAVHAVAALWSPVSGIVDSHALMVQLEADLVRAGGVVVLQSPVSSILADADGAMVTVDGAELRAAHVVIAAGHGSLALAATGLPAAVLPDPPSQLAKGTYYALVGVEAPFSRLVYPVPEAAGLGIHATVDLAGRVRFGPDVEWVDAATADHAATDARRDAFYAAVRTYWPDLPDGALQPTYAGIRPKIVGPGEPSADFRVLGPRDHGVAGITALLGIESPGLTAALALAESVVGTASSR